jgi:hypothetical protein
MTPSAVVRFSRRIQLLVFFQGHAICPAAQLFSCYLFLFFYFKLVVVVRGVLFCGKHAFLDLHQVLGVARPLCAGLLSNCFANANKIEDNDRPVDKGHLVPELSPELCFDRD